MNTKQNPELLIKTKRTIFVLIYEEWLFGSFCLVVTISYYYVKDMGAIPITKQKERKKDVQHVRAIILASLK